MLNDHTLSTLRLCFRPCSLEDLDDFAALNSDPEVRTFFPGGVQTRAQAEARLREFMAYDESHGLPCFVLTERSSGQFVGRAGFGLTDAGEVEVGYLLHKKFWGQGYASEALIALMAYAKRHITADWIMAFTPIEHTASIRVMHKCGMQHYKDAQAKGVLCSFYRMHNS
jgi:ribosomal-protein-alanine N-acetyltransferase